MTQYIYSIRDEKTTFAPPFLEYSDEAAMRGFHFALNKADSLVRYAYTDFSLFRLGAFDTSTGVIVPCEPFKVGSAIDAMDFGPADL